MPVKPFSVARVSLAALALLSTAAPAAWAKESLNFSTPFEVSDNPAGNYLSALIAGADHDTIAAATFFREALRFDPKNPQLIERAFVAALSNGNMLDAFTLGDRLVARDPNNGLAHLALGVKAMHVHNWSAARAQFAKGGPAQSRDITATLLSAWSWGRRRRPAQGARDLRSAPRRQFRGVPRLSRRAHRRHDERQGRGEAPLRCRLRRRQEHAPPDRRLRPLPVAHRRQGRRVESLRGFRRRPCATIRSSMPPSPTSRPARRSIRWSRPPTRAVAKCSTGWDRPAGARATRSPPWSYLRLSLYLAPKNALTQITLADIYDRLHQNEEAIAVYEGVPEGSVLRTTADIQIAQLLDNLGKKQDSADYLRHIVADHPDDEDALLALGNAQRNDKKYAEAVDTYSKALAASKKPEKVEWPLYYFRGISYEREQMWDKAVADFRKALELFPDQPLVLNYLGYSWVDRGQNLDEAFKMLHKAVELRPSDGYIVDSLGWAYFKLGKYDEAVKELERAIDLKPGDPTINDHLGDAYWRVGRKLDAHFQWNHARDLGPEPEDKAKILTKIENGLPDAKAPEAADAKDKGAPDSGDAAPKKDGG